VYLFYIPWKKTLHDTDGLRKDFGMTMGRKITVRQRRATLCDVADDRHQWGESAEATTAAEVSWTMMTRPDLTVLT